MTRLHFTLVDSKKPSSCCLVTKSCPTLCDPVNCSTPGFPVFHYLLEPTQTHVHWVGDAIQPSHPLSSPSSLALSLSQHQSFLMSWLFTSGGQRIGSSAPASVLPMNIQNWFPLGLTGLISLQSKGLSKDFSNTTVWKLQSFSALLYGPALISIRDYWENHHFYQIDLSQQSDVSTFLICCLGLS